MRHIYESVATRAPFGRLAGAPHTLRAGLTLVALVMGGCLAEVGDEHDVADPELPTEKLNNGIKVAEDAEEKLGLVAIPGCSATAIAPTALVTASHCVDALPEDPGRATFLGRSYEISHVIRHPNYPLPSELDRSNQKYDVGLVILETPLLNRQGLGWVPLVRMTNETTEDFVDRLLLCYGRGAPDFNEWHWAGLMGDEIEDRGFLRLRTFPYPSGAHLMEGDSGGPCFVYSNGNPFLVSVNKSAPATAKPTDYEGYAGTVNVLRPELTQWISASIP